MDGDFAFDVVQLYQSRKSDIYQSRAWDVDRRIRSPVPDLEILLEVKLSLTFRVRLTIILACSIFSSERLGKFNTEI